MAFCRHGFWLTALGLAAAIGQAAPSQADEISDFYKGKTVNLLIGVGRHPNGWGVWRSSNGGDTRQLWVLIAINGVIGFVVPQIAWQAHLGGLIAGGLCAAVIAYTPRGPRQGLIQAAGLVAVLVLLIAVSWVKVSTG